MNTRSLLFTSLALAVILLSSCRGIQDIQITGADRFEMKGMENNRLSFSANIGINNPSSVGFKISEVNLKTSVDGSYIGTVTTNEPVKIPARSDSTYLMSFSLELANLLTGASTLYSMTGKKQVTVDMQGYVKARSWLTVKKVDVHETRLISVPSISR
jgi:LEA14-like dessication related protein